MTFERILENTEILNEELARVHALSLPDNPTPQEVATLALFKFGRFAELYSNAHKMVEKFLLLSESEDGVHAGIALKFGSRKQFDTQAWKHVVAQPDHPANQAFRELEEAKRAYKVFTDLARKDPNFTSYATTIKAALPEVGDL